MGVLSLFAVVPQFSLTDWLHSVSLVRSFFAPSLLTEERAAELLKETCVCTAASCPAVPPPAEVNISIFKFILILALCLVPVFLCGCSVGAVATIFKDPLVALVVRPKAEATSSSSSLPAIRGAATPSSLRA